MPVTENGTVGARECPCCGKARPLDWYGELRTVPVRRASDRALAERVGYREYRACWKCRELGRAGLERIDLDEALPSRYVGNAGYTIGG